MVQLRPKPGFAFLVKILDVINPWLVALSIVGLFFEYSRFRLLVLIPNQIISLLFVFDFLVRLIAFPPLRYLRHGWGWVDLIASLPGLLVLIERSPLFAVFKVVRVGRFFRIIRVLRVLRGFDFIKRMKADSPWIQERVMQIGVAVVFVSVVGMVVIDVNSRAALEAYERLPYQTAFERTGSATAAAREYPADVVFVIDSAVVTSVDGNLTGGAALQAYEAALYDPNVVHLEVAFGDARIAPDGGILVPENGLLVRAPNVAAHHNRTMLTLLATLVGLLFVIIFYMGVVFARDMRALQLVIDSFDADDYFLLYEEVSRIDNAAAHDNPAAIDAYSAELDAGGAMSGGPDAAPAVAVVDGDSEVDNLLRMAVKVARKLDASGGGASGLSLGLGGFGADGLDSFAVTGAGGAAAPVDDFRIAELLDQALAPLPDRVAAAVAATINDSLATMLKRSAAEGAKAITPAIVALLQRSHVRNAAAGSGAAGATATRRPTDTKPTS